MTWRVGVEGALNRIHKASTDIILYRIGVNYRGSCGGPCGVVRDLPLKSAFPAFNARRYYEGRGEGERDAESPVDMHVTREVA